MTYELLECPGAVTVISDKRLPFEPSGELLEMRDALRLALRRLAGDRISATFAGPTFGGFDLENVLFYNVGCSAFRHVANHSLYFERLASTDAVHVRWRQHYTTEPTFPSWAKSGRQVDFEIATQRGSVGSVAQIWAATHAARPESLEGELSGPLFLSLDLACPQAVNLAQISKRLIDGIFSALHQYRGKVENEIVQRAAHASGAFESDVRSWLSRTGPLGFARFVWPFRSSLQWSPADDRIAAASLRWTPLAGPEWRVRVSLSECEPIQQPLC